jgi:hypothetical protein
VRKGVNYRIGWIGHNRSGQRIKLIRRTIVKKFVLAITLLALCSASFAQVPGFSKARRQVNQRQYEGLSPLKQEALAKANLSPNSSTDCAFNFVSGTNNTFLNYCVSGNGNIISLETPEGHNQVSFDKWEGYGICDATTNLSYFDFGGVGDSGNWLPATVLSNNGTMVKFARTTSDGLWTLTQTINQVSGNAPNVKITMALRNNTAVPKEALLMRYADVDADSNAINELDATSGTAMAYNSLFTGDGGAPFGLSLENQGNTPFFFDAYSQNFAEHPDPCRPFLNAAGPLQSTDGSIVQLYIMPLNKFQAGTVTVAYRGL